MIDRNKDYCVFRLDDVAPGLDKAKFNRMKDIFDRYQVKPLIGVVPDNQDPKLIIDAADAEKESENKFWDWVRYLQNDCGWTVAQHGHTHVYVNKKPGLLRQNRYSEFVGLSLEEQTEKIRKGKSILEQQGIVSDIFMAPAHTYDRNTLRALKANGFRYVTDGFARYPYEYMGIKFIPCLHDVPEKIKGLATVCLHTNETKDEVYTKIEEFLRNHRDRVLDFEEALEFPSENTFWRLWQAYHNWLLDTKRVVKYMLKVTGFREA